jgi:hypothetical protein
LTKISHRLLILAAFLLISALFSPLSVFAERSDADSAIESAKQQIVICYNAAKAAEAAGANITSLTSLLTEAGELLSESELAYSKNDFATALSLAVQSSQSLTNYVSQANALQASAAQQRSFDFWINVVGSIIGAIGVIVAGMLIFRYVGKRYVWVEVNTDERS